MTPFSIIPWNADFLQAVQELAHELTEGRPGRAVIVIPHSRPRRYLTDMYRRDCHAPMLLPRMMTGEELRDLCRAAWNRGGESHGNPQSMSGSPRRADRLDQVALLKRTVDEVAKSLPPNSPLRALSTPGYAGAGSKDCSHDASNSMAHFFPWGCRLADLLEECLNQMVDAQDLRHAEGEVAPFAAALLGELRAIRGHYLTAMGNAGLTTPGLDAHFVAQQCLRRPPLPTFLQGKSIILAGFVSLTRAENALYRYLWENGAHVCLHTDPNVMEKNGHWACRDHQQWIQSWRADCVVRSHEDAHPPRLHFFAGYDLHSQLNELRNHLRTEWQNSSEDRGEATCELAPYENAPPVSSQAVVLPDASLLMPTLHHLPRKDINISLGYPLERSLLARLVDTVLRVREGLSHHEEPNARHYWRPLLDLFRHPYVRMLRTAPPCDGSSDSSVDGSSEQARDSAHDSPKSSESSISLRPLLRLLEQRLRNGNRLTRLPDVVTELLDDILGDLDDQFRVSTPTPPASDSAKPKITEECGQLLEKVAHVLVDNWNNVRTLRDISRGLANICDLLLQHGRHIWPRFPIDAECLFRLMQKTIPALADNAMADDPLPFRTLSSIVRQALTDERVPFEADPLTGLQVLGMLETRLLRFDSVFLLDVTEDRLPGAPRHDPLLPDNLRGVLGLPDLGRRETLAAHTFYRLLAGAKDVWLFWQEGVESSGLQDSKKVRSRFVEKAIWDVEQAQKQRLSSGTPPLKAAVFPLYSPPRKEKSAIFKTSPIKQRLESLLQAPLSPTRLDSYLHCPAQFFYEHVCRIKPLDEVVEGDDHRQVGKVLHAALSQAFAPYLGSVINMAQARPDLEARLLACFWENLDATDLRDRLPAESRFMLEAAGPLRLRQFLDTQPDCFTLLNLEQEYSTILSPFPQDAEGQRYTLHGVLDRVDSRPGMDHDIILDYKSGSSKSNPSLKFWRDDALWEALETWQPDADPNNDPLAALANALPSVQLPCYITLYRESGRAADNAAWVRLSERDKEITLFPPKLDADARDRALKQQIPSLLNFLLRHLHQAPAFVPHPSRACQDCHYIHACR